MKHYFRGGMKMMTRNRKYKSLAALLGLAMTCGALAGCGAEPAQNSEEQSVEESGSTTEESSEESSQEPEENQESDSQESSEAPEGSGDVVNINWFRTCWHTNVDEKEVEKAINDYIGPKIGVNVSVLNDAESTDLKLALGAGDDIDVFWVASWRYAYDFIDGNIAYDVTDILSQYPGLQGSMPEFVWEAAKNDGRNYYIPIYKECANAQGLTVPTAVVEKYGWDLSTVKELKDIEPMLAQCAADGMEYPIGMNDTCYDSFGVNDFSFITKYAGVQRDGDTTKIVNIAESAQYEEYVRMMYAWNQAGYINQAEASLDVIGEDKLKDFRAEGKNAFYRWAMTPASKENATGRYGMDVEVIPVTDSYLETDSAAGSAYMINAKTEKIDACMKFLELLSTDETLANLAAFGIEGKHYTKTEDGRVSLIADSGYAYPGVWIVCNVNAPSLLDTESADKKAQYEEFNNNAQVSCTAGFRFDKTNVEAEVSALDGVYAEYQLLMDKGFYDPDQYLPEFRSALQTAGIEKVIAEIQAQYTEWLAE